MHLQMYKSLTHLAVIGGGGGSVLLARAQGVGEACTLQHRLGLQL